MTLFTQSVGGSISGSGAPSKKPAKALAGSITSSGAYWASRKTLVGSIAASGSLVLLTLKAFAGRLRMTGIESPTVAGGGTQLVESGGITLAIGGFTRGPT